MDEVQLTQWFVRRATLMKELASVDKLIEQEVLKIGETRKIAGVTAKYFKPGYATPNYEAAARAVMPIGFDLAPFTHIPDPLISWKSVCETLKIDVPLGAEKSARVVIS